MFVPLGPLLTANSSQQACQQVEATLASGSSSSSPVEAGDSGNSTAGSTTYARPLHGKCPLTARKFPPFTALRARQLFAASCPAGSGGLAESKAAQAFPVPRDPDVALLRGQACREEVQKQVLALNPGPGGMVGAAARRLLCARRAGGSGGWWRRALADEWGDALEAWCSAP